MKISAITKVVWICCSIFYSCAGSFIFAASLS